MEVYVCGVSCVEVYVCGVLCMEVDVCVHGSVVAETVCMYR